MNNEIALTYEELKELAANKKLWWQHTSDNYKYYIWVADKSIIYSTEIKRVDPHSIGFDWPAEQIKLTDFETNIMPDSNRPQSLSTTAAQSKFVGRKIELASEDTSGFCEWSFDEDVYLSKMLPVPINAVLGDYAELEVWAPAGGGEAGTDPMMVSQYGETLYFYGTANEPWYVGSGAGKIPQGCTVRCYYHKEAGSERKFIIKAEFLI